MGRNNVDRHGRLVRDPEEKAYKTKDGSNGTMAVFSIAVDNSYGAKTEASFYDCRIFGRKAEALLKFFKKGSEIVVHGEMEQYEYEKDGQKRRNWSVNVSEFDFCGNKGEGSSDQQSGFGPVQDDDIPF